MAFSYDSASLVCSSLALLLSACVVTDPEADAGDEGTAGETADDTTAGGSLDDGSDGGSDDADSTGDDPVDPPADDAAAQLLRRLPGLWVAPVTSMTSVGNFPIMAMDMRPADDRTIFSRVDLDADNNLRFAFTTEELDGESTLIFRNGGEFLGFLRDTRTALVEHNPEENLWRLCAVAGGCKYIEARISFPSEDTLIVSADVLGTPHMHWEGQLEEERAVDGEFPYDTTPGDLTDPFPPMPTLNTTLSWTTPLAEPTEAWLVLTTSECTLVPGSCSPSRFIRGTAPAGATSIELVMDQIHAGDYQATAVLDANGNMAATLFPDSGDRVSLPNQPIAVADRGQSDASIMLLVEL